jgi:hypothetical protein
MQAGKTMVSQSWPLVHEHDDGIRPAGNPRECFYCHSRVGQPHGPECVVVDKRIEMEVTATLPSEDRSGASEEVFIGTWQLDVPHFWTPHDCEFHKNDSSWCASNLLDEREHLVWKDGDGVWAKLEPLDDEQRCLCSTLSFRFLRVVDDTPRRKLRVPGTDCPWCASGQDCPRHPSDEERP